MPAPGVIQAVEARHDPPRQDEGLGEGGAVSQVPLTPASATRSTSRCPLARHRARTCPALHVQAGADVDLTGRLTPKRSHHPHCRPP